MELRLTQLVDRLFKVAQLRNLSDENPIKVTLENPNIQGTTIVVVSVFEPYVYPLPFNVVWVCADANSSLYRVPLKRVSKSPETSTPNFQHSWDRIITFADFFHPPQYYDSLDSTPDDVIHQQFLDHMHNGNNPHGVTADQALALPLSGGILTGPLFLPRSPIETNEASHKGYIDSKYALLHSDLSNVNNTLLSQMVRLDGVETDYLGLENAFTAYTVRPNQVTGFRYTKSTASATWVIPHNMNTKFVTASIYDDTGELVFPDAVKNPDVNTTIIEFLSAVSGYAVISSIIT